MPWREKESNEVTEEDAFNTVQKKQRNLMPIYQLMMLTRLMSLNRDLVKNLKEFSGSIDSSNL